MPRQTLSASCITRPGQLVLLVYHYRDCWQRVLQFVQGLPGSDYCAILPVEADGNIHPAFLEQAQAIHPDFVVCFGEFCEDWADYFHVPPRCVFGDNDKQLRSWPRESVVGLGTPSALPIPLTAVTGVVPSVLGTTIVSDEAYDADSPGLTFSLGRILTYYSRHLESTPSSVGTIVFDRFRLIAGRVFVLVGTGDDVIDLFTYWNARRSPALRSRCIWLPKALFEPKSLEGTVRALVAWALEPRKSPLTKPNAQAYLEFHRLFFTGADSTLWTAITEVVQATLQMHESHVKWYSTSFVAQSHLPRCGRVVDIIALQNGRHWSFLLPDVPEDYGTLAVSEVDTEIFARLPLKWFFQQSTETIRPTPSGFVVYRPQKHGAKALTLPEPDQMDLMRCWLGDDISPSDKAGPVVALVKQLNGLSNCDCFRNPGFFQLAEDSSLESVHKKIKPRMISLRSISPDCFEKTVDSITRELGDMIRGKQRQWYSLSELKSRGFSEELVESLCDKGLFEVGVKLECPVCFSKCYYPATMLAPFTCLACGWQGRTPLPKRQATVYYSLRELVLTLTLGGSLPVMLTLLTLAETDNPRFFPGVMVPMGSGHKEVDIVVLFGSSLYFWEVKHNARYAIAEAQSFLKLCSKYGAEPAFAAFDGIDELREHVERISDQRCLFLKLEYPGGGQSGQGPNSIPTEQ